MRVLEEYLLRSPDFIDAFKAVSNGRALAWLDGRLLGTWIDADGELVLASYHHRRGAWRVQSTATGCSLGGLSTLGMYNPTLAVGSAGASLVWLQQYDEASGNYQYSLCTARMPSALPAELPSASPQLLWDLSLDLGIQGGSVVPDIRDLRALYTSAAQDEAGGLTVVFTERPALSSDPNRARAIQDPGGPIDTEVTAGLQYQSGTDFATADATVASSPDGRVTVVVWEEQGPPEDVPRGEYLMWYVEHHGTGVRDGPFAVRLSAGGASLADYAARGSEPSVVVLEHGIYIAYQQPQEGGSSVVGLIRTDRRTAHTADALWEPVVTGLPDEKVGDGWFPNVAGASTEVQDLLTVVWERTTGRFDDNANKVVELAFVRYGPSRPVPFEVTGWRDLETSEHADDFRFQLGPSVSVGPRQRGLRPVDLVYAEVELISPYEALVELRHITYEFEGDCVRS